ncbi:flagellar assembly peptidoglycan hydrolase FlgJ [Leeia oryzae]|uniref:flagellar assembly peptidoglycan hydrolase FlgJ n=1 Tax=Leeia oryzae TaxID=356662 RepID=UPI0003729010|nr:flagellar assembly peptidoglycan hydrolase FlgJ [Leeia oryzae]
MTFSISSIRSQTEAPALAGDVAAVGQLKAGVHNGNVEAVRKAAKQFESLLMEQMLKSMRASVAQSDLWDTDETKMFQGMYDQQTAMDISSRQGMGLADMLVRQLLPQDGGVAARRADVYSHGQMPVSRTTLKHQVEASLAADTSGLESPVKQATESQTALTVTDKGTSASGVPQGDDFISRIYNGLQRASSLIGVSPKAIAAHAALESGWGKREIRDANGRNSYNLFGIKAGEGWQGRVAEITTTEYVNGSPVKQVDKFRAYDSYEDAFADYAKLLASNDRYGQALNKGADVTGFALALQRGGYATDPNYALKLTQVAKQSRLQALATAS